MLFRSFICGIFNIPAGTFRTGDRNFQLINVDNLTQGTDTATTRAKARFTADSIAVTKQSTTLNVREPLLTNINRIDTRRSTNVEISTQFIPYYVPPGDGTGGGDGGTGTGDGTGGTGGDGSGGDGGDDPIGQSFNINNLAQNAPGIFITQIGRAHV